MGHNSFHFGDGLIARNQGILTPWNVASATNLIQMKLALKIASKIRAGERFALYTVIPIWPEGVPTAAVVQEILYFQPEGVPTAAAVQEILYFQLLWCQDVHLAVMRRNRGGYLPLCRSGCLPSGG